jgi:protein-L-isoaspartate(D-aspartate) O-methyltransferase
MEDLIKKLISDGYLKSSRIISAFRKIRRQDFLPEEFKSEAAVNYPLPIGYNQTISQPLTVAFMLELLAVKSGDQVLDVGSGSGWQTAMLAELVGPAGRVIAIERIPELKKFGERNVGKYGYLNVQFICGDGTKGHQPEAPYDRIVVAAAAEVGIPDILLKQLKVGGRLVIPVGKYEQNMVVMDKVSPTDFKERRYPGFQFVPLVPKKWGE